MPEITVQMVSSAEKIRAFTYNEIELNLKIAIAEQDPYWVEAVYEVPAPLSLAPDKSLPTGKGLIGILQKDSAKEKRVKIFAGSEVYPSTYKVKVTLYVYDKDGAIAERKEYSKELECIEAPKIAPAP
ncbi:MAG: hypothetical protein KGH61_00785 [Candidatus Micrarchaeota archaeon]|nr:hypothetical protein [Candidatus Micrarchaeota archaeon]MDE1847472.1 hypothetical protein [Candidatus Micrarchaeota archaeon]MDE1864033.1 hypothetical protein [Candidatus Micrarchaeota archaeon]